MQHQNAQSQTPNVRSHAQPGIPASETPIPQYDSEQLFHGHRELLIIHYGETYRLKVTRNGKLILNK